MREVVGAWVTLFRVGQLGFQSLLHALDMLYDELGRRKDLVLPTPQRVLQVRRGNRPSQRPLKLRVCKPEPGEIGVAAWNDWRSANPDGRPQI